MMLPVAAPYCVACPGGSVSVGLRLRNVGRAVGLAGQSRRRSGRAARPAHDLHNPSSCGLHSPVKHFARTWAAELAGRGIRVNAISPGPIETPGIRGMGVPAQGEQRLADTLGAMVPLGRTGRPEEVAAAAVFLASDQSSFTTGAELFVDGGLVQV